MWRDNFVPRPDDPVNFHYLKAGSMQIACAPFLTPLRWPAFESTVSPAVLYVCAYRRTGKDTFGRELVSDGFGHSWEIYGRPGTQPDFRDTFVGAPLVAFATKLWDATRKLLSLPDDFNYEGRKDEPVPGHDGKSVRDYMIRVGALGRAIDEAHWVKHALNDSFMPVGYRRRHVVCTDFRFEDEYTCAAAVAKIVVTTVRLYRSAVPIPARDIRSEHDLDSFTTDFLLVPDAAEFGSALCHFPQYAEFVKVGKL